MLPTKKHTILFLAANPSGTTQIALDREARAIELELERSSWRDCFEFVTRWAAEPLDLLRALRKLRPTVVQFSGHGGHGVHAVQPFGSASQRDVVGDECSSDHEKQHGIFFQGVDGRPQMVSAMALRDTFGAAGSSVKLVVLNACYSETAAEALLEHVDCVVGVPGTIHDDAARTFAIGFYGGLGERESIEAAYKQGRAAIGLDGLTGGTYPQLKVRRSSGAGALILAALTPAADDVTLHMLSDVVDVLDWELRAVVRFSITNGWVLPLKLMHLRLHVLARTALNEVRLHRAGAVLKEYELHADIRPGTPVDLLATHQVQFILQPGESEAFRLSVIPDEGFRYECELSGVVEALGDSKRLELSKRFIVTSPIRSVALLRERKGGCS